jgi:hypothetical protein
VCPWLALYLTIAADLVDEGQFELFRVAACKDRNHNLCPSDKMPNQTKCMYKMCKRCHLFVEPFAFFMFCAKIAPRFGEVFMGGVVVCGGNLDVKMSAATSETARPVSTNSDKSGASSSNPAMRGGKLEADDEATCRSALEALKDPKKPVASVFRANTLEQMVKKRGWPKSCRSEMWMISISAKMRMAKSPGKSRFAFILTAMKRVFCHCVDTMNICMPCYVLTCLVFFFLGNLFGGKDCLALLHTHTHKHTHRPVQITDRERVQA